MATICFDREIRVRPEDMDRFLDAITNPPKHTFELPDPDKEMREGRERLRNALRFTEIPTK